MSAETVKAIFREVYDVIKQREDELGKLDAVAGDGDHGTGMVRGLKAARSSVDGAETDILGTLISDAGAAFSDAAGGSSGALVGIFIITVGNKFPAEVTTLGVAEAMRLGLERMKKLGKAEACQKTMLDTLQPFVDALERSPNKPLAEAWLAALPAAAAGMEATKTMKSQKGRAARLSDRSQGHADPGAVSMNYILGAVGRVLERSAKTSTG
ncbi:hypothetical protein BH24DEI2_BH24DEI2_08670 [soil metagenome]